MSMKKTWLAATILCGTMVIGIGIGSVGTVLVFKFGFEQRRPAPMTANIERHREPIKDFYLRRMDRKLHLSNEQLELVREELDVMADEFRAYHDSLRENIDAITSRADEAIKKHLTAEQVEIFEEAFVKRRKFGNPGDHHPHKKDWDRRNGPPMPSPHGGGFAPPPGSEELPPDDQRMHHPPPGPKPDTGA